MTRAAIYMNKLAKVNSIQKNQLQPLEQFCKSRGFEVARYYAENDTSMARGPSAGMETLSARCRTPAF